MQGCNLIHDLSPMDLYSGSTNLSARATAFVGSRQFTFSTSPWDQGHPNELPYLQVVEVKLAVMLTPPSKCTRAGADLAQGFLLHQFGPLMLLWTFVWGHMAAVAAFALRRYTYHTV